MRRICCRKYINTRQWINGKKIRRISTKNVHWDAIECMKYESDDSDMIETARGVGGQPLCRDSPFHSAFGKLLKHERKHYSISAKLFKNETKPICTETHTHKSVKRTASSSLLKKVMPSKLVWITIHCFTVFTFFFFLCWFSANSFHFLVKYDCSTTETHRRPAKKKPV